MPQAPILASRKLMAFVATTDPERAKAFYHGKLGLPLIEADQFAVVFDAAGTMLRVAIVQEMTPARYTVLGWHVPDIVSAVNDLQAAGVVFQRYPGMEQDELGIWKAPGGAKVAWFKDPDGNVLSLAQF